MGLLDQPYFKRHHDDDYIDEIKFETVPRYKTSGLSGDEWRTSVTVKFYRKGHLLYERSYSRLRYAVAHLPWLAATLSELSETDGYHHMPSELEHSLCFQPGCKKKAAAVYQLKQEFSSDGHKLDPSDSSSRPIRVAFCKEHLRRGDCGREDADDNYEVVSGPGPDEASVAIEHPAQFGGVIELKDE